MRPRSVIVATALVLGVAACEAPKEDKAPAAETTPPPEQQAAAPAPVNPDTPHIYMALQPAGSGPLSVVFAIDSDRDNTPSNDPAIRITPEDGQCNPQEMRRYSFPAGTAQRPIFGPQEASSGISARELPNFMAMAVTSEMMRRGLIVQPDDSKPQNVCTRKLWEQLVVNESTGQG